MFGSRPAGDRIGFLEHPIGGDDSGHVVSLTLSGRRQVLTKDFYGIVGLAWEPGGERLLFGAARPAWVADAPFSRWRWTGKLQLLRRETGHLTIQDVAKDGSLLLTRDIKGDEVFGHFSRREGSLDGVAECVPSDISERRWKPLVAFGSGRNDRIRIPGLFALYSPRGSPQAFGGRNADGALTQFEVHRSSLSAGDAAVCQFATEVIADRPWNSAG